MPAAQNEVKRVRQVSHVERVAPDPRSASAGKSPRSRGAKATHAIRELAERQHGVVAYRDLLALGMGRGLIQARLENGWLVPLHRGVFALGHRRIGPRGEWMAAVLACGEDAVLSHASAAQLWGLRASRGPIEVTRTAGHRRPRGVRLHQTRSLPPEDRQVEAGIPVTSIERMVLDMAARLDDRQLEHLLVEADRDHRLRWSELGRVIEGGRGKKGTRRLRRVAALVSPMAAETLSSLEVDFLILCRDAGLPQPQVNSLVKGRVVDFCWPAARVIVETDGYKFHKGRPAFEHDHESTVALEASGYRVHRATYRMLRRNPGAFLALVRESLRASGAFPAWASLSNRV